MTYSWRVSEPLCACHQSAASRFPASAFAWRFAIDFCFVGAEKPKWKPVGKHPSAVVGTEAVATLVVWERMQKQVVAVAVLSSAPNSPARCDLFEMPTVWNVSGRKWYEDRTAAHVPERRRPNSPSDIKYPLTFCYLPRRGGLIAQIGIEYLPFEFSHN